MSPSDSQPFLADRSLRCFDLPDVSDLTPIGLALGEGPQGLEVAVAEADGRPRATDLRWAWNKRKGGRAAPLLLVALHDGQVSVCGPAGDNPPVYRDLDPVQAERICRSALDTPDRHAALAFLRDVLPEAESPVPGLKNSGLMATHELEVGVPRRPDWRTATERARPLLSEGGREVLRAMGYELESLRGPASVLTADGTRQAVAVFLDQDQAIELSAPEFSGLSPVSYALAQADQHRLPWVVVAKGAQLRLYSAEAGTGVASRGRTETYVQVRTDLLREDEAGYLWFLFSPDALADGGTVEEILDSSKDYAADLRSRLRERVYDEVVPDLAEALARARDLEDPTQEKLDETYQITLLLLYRLLFVAYAEDRRLLPYETNESYRSRSLKQKAHELRRIVEEEEGFDETATHWREVAALFRAIREGSTEWDVPQYDGTLFADDPDLSPEGAALEAIELTNREFGPPLSKLLLDEGSEGLGPIDFRSLGVREFGTIYEGLLEAELSVANRPLAVDADGEYVPAEEDQEVEVERGSVYLHDTSGTRKRTGTYYTKTFAVEHLLEHSLDPALDRHLEELDELGEADASERFFDFRVADIAMGSGHFLLAAVDHIEERFAEYLAERQLPRVRAELERLRTRIGEELGDPALAREIEDSQLLRRQIARRCIYGVDLNPVAVHLARLSVWIHTFVPGLPLSFLDHGLVEGNSLLGIATLEEAHEALGLLDEQVPAWAPQAADLFERAHEAVEQLGRLSDADASEIRQAREAQRELEEKEAPYRALFDILTAARIDDKLRDEVAQGAVLRWKNDLDSLPGSAHHQRAQETLDPLHSFHFPVQFPEVFRSDRSGFDVIIGNPPWEQAKIERDEFWRRHHPGLSGMTTNKQKEKILELEENRPDLLQQFLKERAEQKIRSQILTSGSYPDMGRGDPDLYQGFAWRFWTLVHQDGYVGVVLPRAAFISPGAETLRYQIVETAGIQDITFLLNKGHWVFDGVEPRYTIALAAFRKSSTKPTAVRRIPIRGPFSNEATYRKGMQHQPVCFSVQQVREWAGSAKFPLLPEDPKAERVLKKITTFTHLDSTDADWRALPYREDIGHDQPSGEDELETNPEKVPDHFWPVFKGASFSPPDTELWIPDTGVRYAWADPAPTTRYLQSKRQNASSYSRSAMSQMSREWIADKETLPCLSPRVALRKIARGTDQRTLLAALVPPKVFLNNTVIYFLWPAGSEREEAYLLGLLNSIPLDWYARRFVETHLTYQVIKTLPIPRPGSDHVLKKRVIRLAGRLSAIDQRYKEWARKVGVECGDVSRHQKMEMIYELDAVVALLYGLSREFVEVIFRTFHEGWDPTDRLERTLIHYEAWQERM